jgi:hypothetical protein
VRRAARVQKASSTGAVSPATGTVESVAAIPTPTPGGFRRTDNKKSATLFNTIYLLTSLPPPMTDRVDLALHCSVLENLAPAKVATNQRVATPIISGVPP